MLVASQRYSKGDRGEDKDAGYILKAVAVVSRYDNQRLFIDTQLLELGNSSTDGVVELQKITQSTIVVKDVHLLVDGSSLGHEEESLLATALVQDINSLEGHLLETGQVKSRPLSTLGVVLEGLEVVLVDVAVQPDGHDTLAKDTKSLLVVVGSEEGLLVSADRVSFLGELGIVVLALVRTGTGEELLSTATEEDIRTTVVGPGVVGHAVEGLVNQGAVLAAATSVAAESNGSGIGKESGGDSTPNTFLRQDISQLLTIFALVIVYLRGHGGRFQQWSQPWGHQRRWERSRRGH